LAHFPNVAKLDDVPLFQVDGGWSGWSDWFRCDYTTAGRESRHNGDDNAFCNCRKRVCDSPAPANGGIDCDSLGLEVTNCTQHGGWTAWSAFSACSKTCDVGMKHRKRTCGNPTPAFGGEGCIGRDVDSQYCDDLPPCSASSSPAAASSAALVRHGSWTQWAEWSECSALCGKGFRLRTRKCYGAAECVGGCDRDYQECEGRRKDCSSVSSDVMEVTDWTPWIRSNSSINGAYYEKRFRFTYRGVDGADVTGSDNLREEERFCQGRNQCSVTSVRGGSSRTPYSNSWSEWSKCSRECGSGYQVRIRSNGLSVVERPCNTRPCTGSWSCWSEWSVGCDHRGKKTRTRECDAGKFPLSSEVVCQGGSDREEADCDSEGWGGWNDWSDDCDASGYQKRYRICLANQCIGDDQDRRPCPGISSDGTVAPGVTSPQQTATATIAGAVIVGFLIGAFTGAGIVYFFLVYRRLGRGANGSPHYVSAKSQNLYVSLPMLDLNRHNGGNNHYSSNQSDCGTMRSTTTTGSTLRSNKNSGGSVYGVRAGNGSVVSPVVDYETATIKRSHSQRNSSILVANGCNGTLNMRADLGEDNLFT
jgi:semaphorin 5